MELMILRPKISLVHKPAICEKRKSLVRWQMNPSLAIYPAGMRWESPGAGVGGGGPH